MADRAHIGLDNASFRGRLRERPSYSGAQPVKRGSSRPITRNTSDGFVRANNSPNRTVSTRQVRTRAAFIAPSQSTPATPVKQSKLTIIAPQPYVAPATVRQQKSHVLQRQLVQPAKEQVYFAAPTNKPKRSKLQMSLVGMAAFVFLIGIGVSVQTLLLNRNATAQVAALAEKADKSTDSPVPSSSKPSDTDISNYVVAPDMARYIKIPKLGVNARVLQVGATKTGALQAPSNVHDSGWYTGSAKPGQTGATLIDGHVSSWSSQGVFYGIKNLVAGDTIQIVRGDGVVLNYRVAKIQVYDADKVDMKAAVNPVTIGKSGLNLITCDGKVESGTSEFDKRVIVFAEQV